MHKAPAADEMRSSFQDEQNAVLGFFIGADKVASPPRPHGSRLPLLLERQMKAGWDWACSGSLRRPWVAASQVLSTAQAAALDSRAYPWCPEWAPMLQSLQQRRGEEVTYSRLQQPA